MPRIQTDVPLQRLNTFGLPATARRLASIASAGDVDTLLQCGALANGHLILGGGSNTLFEGDPDGLVLRVTVGGRRMVSAGPDGWLVEAGAGENWHAFVRWTLAQGWPGLENLSLIPGTVGAAPIQNIGAYGLEMAEHFHSLDAIGLPDGTRRTFGRQDCRFGYRDSVFKHEAPGRWLILAVRFLLPRAWTPRLDYGELASALVGGAAPTPETISDAVIDIRRRKLPDPEQLGNAGSFFKNPVLAPEDYERFRTRHDGAPAYPQADGTVKLAAGWLIEQCGWKGRDLGPVGVFERQALVLVNRGTATGKDVRRLAEAVRASVRERFAVALETEPVFVGSGTTEPVQTPGRTNA